MFIQHVIPLAEETLNQWKDSLGKDYKGYKNHVYRVIHFCHALQQDLSDEQNEKIIIAASFHDLGVWANNTFDYLSPSAQLAKQWLLGKDLEHYVAEIELMIEMHHKFTAYKDSSHPLVELFRCADWIDVSKGRRKYGLDTSTIKRVLNTFPNAGFHKALIRLTKARIKTHPFSPLPMMRW